MSISLEESGTGRGGACQPRVTVIIPAFNAGRWIGRTLASAQRQSIDDIEIIVVDDGSTDETAAIVEARARTDSRIRLMRQPNGGVARARNTGIAAARGDYLAPLDADDLWHPRRLELHLEAFARADDDVALVYSPFVRIDDQDMVRYPQPFMGIEGHVFEQHLCENFIGNGSGVTVRTSVAREIGGYSPRLRDSRAEGFEDWLFQLKIAYRHRFACVPLNLIGYRMSEGAMSSDYLQMSRSGALGMREIEEYAKDVARPLFWWPQARACGQFAAHRARKESIAAAIVEIATATLRNPLVPAYVPIVIADRLYQKARSMAKTVLPRRRRSFVAFEHADPSAVRRRAPTISTYLWIRLYRWLGERRLAAGSSRLHEVDGPAFPDSKIGVAK